MGGGGQFRARIDRPERNRLRSTRSHEYPAAIVNIPSSQFDRRLFLRSGKPRRPRKTVTNQGKGKPWRLSRRIKKKNQLTT